MTTIIVLGMHRSGTSAVTRALHLLGASFGVEGSVGQYWEHGALRDMNDRLLSSMGGGWDGIPPLTEDWASHDGFDRLRARARRLLRREFRDVPVSVWKDPRTCLTMPFWRPLFPAPPVFVLIHRHPTESARSLAVRNEMGLGHAFAMWERHNADALRAVVGERVAVVSYAPLLEEPRSTMVALAEKLRDWGVVLPNDAATTPLELDESRRHHAAVEEDPDISATPSQLELRALLEASNGSHDVFELPGAIPRPDPLSVEILTLAGAARYNRAKLHRASERLRALRDDDPPAAATQEDSGYLDTSEGIPDKDEPR